MATIRRKVGAFAAATAIASSGLLFGAAAQAQTSGYPPGTGGSGCTAGNVNLGNVGVGQTVTFTLCGGFTAGVSVTVNGATVLSKPSTNGAVAVVITVVSQTVLQVGDPVDVAAACGTNTVVATGPGTPGTSTGTFNLQCRGGTPSSGLAFTGTNIRFGLLSALALIAVGTMLVVVQRRRRQTT